MYLSVLAVLDLLFVTIIILLLLFSYYFHIIFLLFLTYSYIVKRPMVKVNYFQKSIKCSAMAMNVLLALWYGRVIAYFGILR